MSSAKRSTSGLPDTTSPDRHLTTGFRVAPSQSRPSKARKVMFKFAYITKQGIHIFEVLTVLRPADTIRPYLASRRKATHRPGVTCIRSRVQVRECCHTGYLHRGDNGGARHAQRSLRSHRRRLGNGSDKSPGCRTRSSRRRCDRSCWEEQSESKTASGNSQSEKLFCSRVSRVTQSKSAVSSSLKMRCTNV